MKFEEKNQEIQVKRYYIDNWVQLTIRGYFSFPSSLAHAFGSRGLYKDRD